MQVQRLFFKHVHKLRDLALANCGTVEKRDTLRKYLNLLEPDELKFLVTQQLRQAPALHAVCTCLPRWTVCQLVDVSCCAGSNVVQAARQEATT